MHRLYRLLARLFVGYPPPANPQRILILKPCCIGDVVMATALLTAIRRAYPQAHITFAVGAWSIAVLDKHEAIDSLLNVGDAPNPAKGVRRLWRLIHQLHGANCDLAFIPDRSPLLGLAVWLARIPHRVGLDSDGRGFAHTVRVPISPTEEANEGEIYLRLASTIGIPTDGIYTHITISSQIGRHVQNVLDENGIASPYIVIHPAGGANPGMVMTSKRWLPSHFASLATWLYQTYNVQIIFIGAKTDTPIIEAVTANLSIPYHTFLGAFSLLQVGALARGAMLYIGNDTGLTHLAVACGGKTAMILGPSSPNRYAPYHPNGLALWKPVALQAGGVSAGESDWDWERDGIGVADATDAIRQFLSGETTGGVNQLR